MVSTEVAIREFEHHKLLAARLEELGAKPHEAMARFRPALDEWHRRCQPTDWYEGLMKVYAGSSIASDFYAECGRFVDPQTRALVEQVLDDADHYAYAKQELEAAIVRDPKLAARMALWGRRIVGEALSQAQRAAADNDELTALLVDDGSGRGLDLAELAELSGGRADPQWTILTGCRKGSVRRGYEASGLTGPSGAGAALDRYLDSARGVYDLAVQRFLYGTFASTTALVRADVATTLAALGRDPAPVDISAARRGRRRRGRRRAGRGSGSTPHRAAGPQYAARFRPSPDHAH